MAPGLQTMDVDNGDGNILKVLIDENKHLLSDEMLASDPAVHHAPEPAGVHRPGGELSGGLHHHLCRGQQGECGQIQALISPNDVTLQALLRRMFGENQVGETWK